MTSRRQFLKVGAVTGLGLTVLGTWYGWGRVSLGAAGSHFTLAPEAREIVAALVPVILAGALPEGAERAANAERAVAGVERAIAGLGASAQAEVQQLFALLGFAPTRVLLAGVTSQWRETAQADAAAFLERWRFSRFGLLRSAYAAMHDLVLGAWYGVPEGWQAIGYPGPPEMP
jgi:hypothetical protein